MRLTTLSVTTFTPTLGIIDRDYRIPLGTLMKSPNLIWTDLRDLECMMFDSPSFAAVLGAFGSSKKIEALGGSEWIAAAVRRSAVALGALRFYSQQLRLGTSFQKLELSRVVDKKTLAIDSAKLVAHLNAQQGSTSCVLPTTVGDLAKKTCSEALCERGLSYFQHDLLLCRGHDLMGLLAIGFRSLFGSRSAAESTRENVEVLFRLNYVAHFRATSMARAIHEWLIGNGLDADISIV
jgi:hypothetical protein